MTYPIDAVIAVTYRCQSRCRMCSLWQIKERDDVAPAVYEKLPTTLRDVNISGGEPFLRKDLADIVKIVHQRLPRARMVVSSNGFMGESLVPRALELVEIFPGVGFAFSIDGIGEKHDFIRGVEGGFDKAIAVVKKMKTEGINNIRLAYTLTAENAEDMIKVYDLARGLGVQFTMSVSHESDFFFGKNESSLIKEKSGVFDTKQVRADFRKLIKSELGSYNVKRWGRAFIFYGSYKLAVEGKQLFGSRPGTDYFYLDPGGNVYPSVIHDHVMGNLAADEFDAIWASKTSEEARGKCAADKSPYWMGCMLRKALLNHRFQIGIWVLKNKYLGLKM